MDAAGIAFAIIIIIIAIAIGRYARWKCDCLWWYIVFIDTVFYTLKENKYPQGSL